MKKAIIPIILLMQLVSCFNGINDLFSLLRDEYRVTYDANGGTGDVPTDSKIYQHGAMVTVLDAATLTNGSITFTCWNTRSDGNGTDRAPGATFSIGSANVTLYAKWTTLPTYTVTYDANTGTGSVPSDSNNYLAGASVTVLGSGSITRSGYTFTCWNTQTDGNGTDRAPGSTFSKSASTETLYAKWTALPTYAVAYNANGGTGGLPSDPNNYLAGASVTVLSPSSLTISGYTFTCWNTQADGNGTDRAPGATFAIGSASVTLYAKWTALPTYTVTYNANTGTGGVPSDINNYLEGASVTVLSPGSITKPGYTFTCWNTQADGNGTNRAPGATFSKNASAETLYAVWTALPTYTVTYNANTGTGGVPSDINNYLAGADVTVLSPGSITRSGYTFTCWNTQADGNGTNMAPGATFAIGSANVTLYAKWTALPTYTVTYDANTGTGGVPSDINNYLTGASVTVLNPGSITKPLYTFTCWNTQSDGNGTNMAPGTTFAIGSANVTLYAKWTALPTYTVTYDANTGTGGVPSDANNYLTGTDVTVKSPGSLIRTGYVFSFWNTQADGNGDTRFPEQIFAMGSANVTLYAIWTSVPTYTVTYDANTGTGSVPADFNNYLEGATVTVLSSGSITKPGYTFTCWNTQADGNGTNRSPGATFPKGASAETLYAVWSAFSLEDITIGYNTREFTYTVTFSPYIIPVEQGICWTSENRSPTIADYRSTANSPVQLTGLASNTTYHVRPYAVIIIDGLPAIIYMLSELTFNTEPAYALGDTGPGGGIVFYENLNYQYDGWRYLEAATGDIPAAAWIDPDNQGYFLNNTLSGMGEGYLNKSAILGISNVAGFAETLCRDYTGGGQSDWYLPSVNEILEMSGILEMSNHVSLTPSTPYWTSTESSDYYAFSFKFIALGNTTFSAELKSESFLIRPVRRF